MIGTTLGHYRITEKLGAGGMGEVYRAQDLKLKRQVALKFLPQELSESPARLQRFQREAEILAALAHPSIVTIHSVEEVDGLRFLTMEYIDGQPLSEVIPKHGMRLDRFFEVAVPLTDAVSAAHEKGIVHRDLKPSNVMITRDGRVKVLDFGLGKLLQEPEDGADPGSVTTELLTGESSRLGTLPYMSPEQIVGGPTDHRSDIFALGIILHQMACGRYPFRRTSPSDLASSILGDTPSSVDELRAGLPHELALIIRHCLEKKLDERMQSAKDLRNELKTIAQELSTPTLTEAARPGRLGRAAAGRIAMSLAAAALAILVGLYLWKAWVPGDASPPTGRPRYLGVELVPSFAANTTAQAIRGGLVPLLEGRLRGLQGVYVVSGSASPKPDFVLQVDLRRDVGPINLSYRLVEAGGGDALIGEVVQGPPGQLFALVDRLGHDLAARLAARLEEAVAYRSPPPPTSDGEAIMHFLTGLHGLANPEAADREGPPRAFQAAWSADPRFALARVYHGLALRHVYLASLDGSLLVEAEALCREAAQLEPRLELSHHCLGEVLRSAGRHLQAVEEYRRAIELGLRDAAVYYGARDAYIGLGRPASEERFWQQMVEIDPRFWAGYYFRGWSYLDQGRHDAALQEHRRAIELAPTNTELYLGLFGVQFELGRFAEAIDTMELAIEVAPDDHRAWANLGHVYFLLRRFDEAIAAFERAVALEESDFQAQGYLARAYYWAPGRRQEARAHLERAIQIGEEWLARNPESAEAKILLAGYQAMMGRPQASRLLLSAALDLRPNDTHYLYLAGLIENLLGEESRALDYLARAIAGGWRTAELRTTIEVDNLRDEPRFQALLKSKGG